MSGQVSWYTLPGLVSLKMRLMAGLGKGQ
jgi:hypothetical protein